MEVIVKSNKLRKATERESEQFAKEKSYREKLKKYGSIEKLNLDISEFVNKTNAHLDFLDCAIEDPQIKIETAYENLRIKNILREAQDFLNICAIMCDCEETVPRQLVEIIILLYRIKEIYNSEDELIGIIDKLLFDYDWGPFIEELLDA